MRNFSKEGVLKRKEAMVAMLLTSIASLIYVVIVFFRFR